MIVDRLSPSAGGGVRALDDRPYATAIGSFDGVHRGHQYLISCLREAAALESPVAPGPALAPVEPNPLMDPTGMFNRGQSGCDPSPQSRGSLVITFDPLPFEVLHSNAPAARLTDIDERLDLLAALGVDRVGVVEFTPEVAALSAADFLAFLASTYRIQQLWCGRDFAFGYNREGTVDFLLTHGEHYGISVEVISRIDLDGVPVASREVRRLVADGQTESATALLGHHPTVSGEVIRGAQRGRQLGFPTANLRVPAHKLIPKTGIYAGFARLTGEGADHVAAISVGHNPTFGAHPLSVEAFILDFDREILGHRLTVEFGRRLRDEITFDSVDALVRQMSLDVAATREYAGNLR